VHGLAKAASSLAMAFAAVVLPAPAQSPQSGEPAHIRVDVREVWVPVFVTDTKGHNVTGLKASDFSLQEDGIPQTVTAFTASTAPGAEGLVSGSPGSGGAVSRPSAGPRHTFVICVDTLHLDPGNAGSLRDALKRLFEKEKPENAQFSVVAIGRQIQVLETATADPGAVAAKNANAALQAGGAGAVQLRGELLNLKTSMYDFCRRCPSCGSHDRSRVCDSDIQSLKAGLDAQASPWAMRTGQMLEQLKAVVEELAKLPGGRTLIFASDGFSLDPAREFYGVAAAFLPGDPRFQMAGPTDLEPKLRAVIRAAVNGNVRVQSVDSRGVVSAAAGANGSMDAANPSDWSPPSVMRRTPASSRGGTLLTEMDRQAGSIAFQAGSGMEQLAESTGGVYYHGSNDTLRQLRSALADGREYYLLGYVSTNAAPDGKFRSIAVELRDKKLHVRAKRGYWAPGAADGEGPK
jgi:VWFA-related protein